MRRLPSLFLLPALAAVGTAQSATLHTDSQMGVFAQIDGQPAKYTTLPASTEVTLDDAGRVRADRFANYAAIAHSRAKASLRMLDDLPAVRIHEVGLLSTLANPRQRAIGSAAKPGSAGKSVEPHAFLLRLRRPAGERVRVHIRLATEYAGRNPAAPNPTLITGAASVDVGNDRTIEFARILDGRRHLDNHTVTIGSSGVLDIRIVTGCLLTSTAATPASYSMTLDVQCEPVGGILAALEPFGPQCGPDVYGVSWVDGTRRHARTVLEGAAPNASALIVAGPDRIRLPIPGVTCDLLTSPATLIPTQTNAVGRIVSDYPTIPANLSVEANFQYAVISAAGVRMSKGLGFRVFPDSPRPYDHFDVNHVLATGQSLAIGGLGRPVLSTSQPYGNQMFSTGLTGLSGELAPLVEATWETMSSGMSSTASRLYKIAYNNPAAAPTNDHDILVSIHAVAGLPYLGLKQGTAPFETGMSQFRMAKFIAESQRRSYVVRCVTNVHGETDHTHFSTDYARNLVAWQRDYETAIQARGQTEPVPMLHSQMSSFTKYGTRDSIIPGLQLEASVAHPRKLPLVGPKYFLQYVDGVHLTSRSYRHMGEYYGKVYNHVIVEGATWEPLRPLTARRTGTQIEVRFHVPVPPLVLDTTLVSDPGNYGFEYADDSGNPPTISSVYLLDEDTVAINLSHAPQDNARKWIAYALTGTAGADAGPRTGARGNLRDTDRTPSLFGERLYNWAVHFAIQVQ